VRSTITARRQTVIPAPIRARFALGPSQRLIADRQAEKIVAS
jgi:bifunctional DNA-binding transcriptional regulator/antitoxin component of YhaV-PrlF toxin-antitoxin module